MIFFTLLLAAFVGSPHCAGMCGGFVGLVSSPDFGVSNGSQEASNSRGRLCVVATGYHLGRLFTYASLGALSGAFGAAINRGSEYLGVVNAAALIVGVWLVVTGVRRLSGPRVSGPRDGKLATSGERARITSRIIDRLSDWERLLGRVLSTPFRVYVRRRASIRRQSQEGSDGRAISHRGFSLRGVFPAFMVGATSTLLPCGFLYLFVVTAAGSGSLSGGLVTMAALWLGTLPILLGVGHLSRFASQRLQPLLPRIVGAALVAAGVFSLYMHLRPMTHERRVPCHTASVSWQGSERQKV